MVAFSVARDAAGTPSGGGSDKELEDSSVGLLSAFLRRPETSAGDGSWWCSVTGGGNGELDAPCTRFTRDSVWTSLDVMTGVGLDPVNTRVNHGSSRKV
jgi:hypothetical protein